MEKKQTFSTPVGEITLSTGKMAFLADGSVLVQKGGTVLHATVVFGKNDTDGDFLPLTIEYVEKMYAAGLISGSRYIKREGRPSDEETIRKRLVDHTIRPLFPKGLRREIMVVLEVIAFDGINNPEELSVIGASTATLLSGLPFAGPAAGVVVGVKQDGSIAVNPDVEHEDELLAEYVVSGNKGKILNIEGWSKQVSEEVLGQILDAAGKNIDALCDIQTEFVEGVRKAEVAYVENEVLKAMADQIKSEFGDKIKAYLYAGDKLERNGEVQRPAMIAEILAAHADWQEAQVSEMLAKVERYIMRDGIIKESKRLSGRKLDEIRELKAEVDVLPTVHGSALFSRGLTQSLSVVALGAKKQAQVSDDMWGESEKYFMHHYKMPGYTTGEASRYKSSPNGREVGHGMIGENALRFAIAPVSEFPYTIRVAAEIMTSNGSTSMAATCASSLALMAAGVPMDAAIAGIGVGLVVADEETQNDYRLLLDIEGIEDFYGDMDFKVTGSDKGITAIQFETKLQGVRPEILKEAFALSRQGRLQVLEVMNSAIAKSREDLAPNAPRVVKLQINPEFIGAIIGPGGKNIKQLTEEASNLGSGPVDINIEDDGTVLITSVSKVQSDFVAEKIKLVSMTPEIGEIYEGIVDKVMPYGAFVDVSPSLSGLVHVSELAAGFIKDPTTVVKEGDKVKVKLIAIEGGKYSFSIKQADPDYVPAPKPEGQERPQRFERRNDDRRPRWRDNNDR